MHRNSEMQVYLLLLVLSNIACYTCILHRIPFLRRFSSKRNSLNEQKKNGFVGIKNLGNTCYMNAVLQSLYRNKLYKVKILNAKFKENSVGKSLQNLFQQLDNSEVGNTSNLCDNLSINALIQEDAQEFYLKLLNKVDESIINSNMANDNTENNQLSSIFCCETQNIIRCINIDFTKYTKKRNNLSLSVDINNTKDLLDSINNYFAVEKLNEYNTSNGIQEAEKNIKIVKLPETLCVHLKRFAYDDVSDSISKIGTKFEFPLSLDIGSYCSNITTSSSNYKLQTIVIHDGNAQFGHYTCYSAIDDSNKWLLFNDNLVTEVTLDTVQKDGYGYSSNIFTHSGSKTGYLLFYNKLTK